MPDLPRSERARRPAHDAPRRRHWRHYPRVSVHALTATIAQARERPTSVLNISERGMLVEGLALAPGTAVEFALNGEQLHGTGSGAVVYRTDDRTAIAVEDWHGTLDRAVRDMINKALLAASAWWELYVDPPARSRPDDRAWRPRHPQQLVDRPHGR